MHVANRICKNLPALTRSTIGRPAWHEHKGDYEGDRVHVEICFSCSITGFNVASLHDRHAEIYMTGYFYS